MARMMHFQNLFHKIIRILVTRDILWDPNQEKPTNCETKAADVQIF